MVVLDQARRRAGVSIAEWARLGRTSRPTLSAYLHGRSDPRLSTVSRLLAAIGFELALAPLVEEKVVVSSTGRRVPVLTALRALPPKQALGRVSVPPDAGWTGRRVFDLANRASRCEYYWIVLRLGLLDEIVANVDATLLAADWEEVSKRLDPSVREAWEPSVFPARR